jgi:hypothetical protein
LQINEACKVLFKENFFSWCINVDCLDMLVTDFAQPRLELLCITDGCTQCKEWTGTAPDDPLEGIALGSIKSVDLVEDEVFKLTTTSVS